MLHEVVPRKQLTFAFNEVRVGAHSALTSFSSPIWPWWAYCPARPYFAQYKFVFISILKVVRSFSEGCVLNQIYQHINQHMINLCGTFFICQLFLVLLKKQLLKIFVFVYGRKTPIIAHVRF